MSVKVLVLFASLVVYLVLSRVWFGGWTFQMFQMIEAEVHVPTMWPQVCSPTTILLFPLLWNLFRVTRSIMVHRPTMAQALCIQHLAYQSSVNPCWLDAKQFLANRTITNFCVRGYWHVVPSLNFFWSHLQKFVSHNGHVCHAQWRWILYIKKMGLCFGYVCGVG
jgi:hypothetical protein